MVHKRKWRFLNYSSVINNINFSVGLSSSSHAPTFPPPLQGRRKGNGSQCVFTSQSHFPGGPDRLSPRSDRGLFSGLHIGFSGCISGAAHSRHPWGRVTPTHIDRLDPKPRSLRERPTVGGTFISGLSPQTDGLNNLKKFATTPKMRRVPLGAIVRYLWRRVLLSKGKRRI
jgi:hypothetical protein